MIKAHNVEDMTNSIREKKHSNKIKNDVDNMIRLKKEYEEMGITDSSIDKYTRTISIFTVLVHFNGGSNVYDC